MRSLKNAGQKQIKMKYFFCIFILLLSVGLSAQSKKTIQLLNKSRLLEETVFGTKDSATLEKLFAKTLIYEHSSGKIETREQAIQGIIHNQSKYEKPLEIPTGCRVMESADSMVTKNIFKATETKQDGTVSELNLTIEMVWIKERGDWKLTRRKAVKNK
jgi:ketosteroid isomerase-like protein